VAIHNLKEVHLRPEILVPGKDAGDVHHLGKPDDLFPPPEPGEVGGGKPGAAQVERCCRDTRGEHHQDVERRPRPFGKHILDSGRSTDVCYLVGVGNHGRRAVSKDEPGILRRREEGALDVDVGVDQPGNNVGPREVVLPLPLVIAETDNATVPDREVRALPGARERVEDIAAGEDGVRRLKPSRRGKSRRDQGATSRSRMTDVLRSPSTNMVRKSL